MLGLLGAGPPPGSAGSASTFGTTLATPQSLSATQPSVLATGGAVLAGLALLVLIPPVRRAVPAPAAPQASGWRRAIARLAALPPVRAVTRWVRTTSWESMSIPGTVLLAAFLAAFLDPDIGVTMATARLILAAAVGLVLVNGVWAASMVLLAGRWFGTWTQLMPLPAWILVTLATVVASRTVGIQPGLLFGLVIGATFGRSLRARDAGRLAAGGAGAVLGLALVAWLGYGLLAARPVAGFFALALQEVLVATTVTAVTSLAVTLLPVRAMEGSVVLAWSRTAWVGLYTPVLAMAVFVVLPLPASWAEASAGGLAWLAVLGGLAAVVVVGVVGALLHRGVPARV